MLGRWLLGLLAPLMLAAALGACNDNGVQPGVVQTSAAGGYRGESGRVVAIREVPLRNGGSGMNDGTLVGGGVGAAGGAICGAAVRRTARHAIPRGVVGAGLAAPAAPATGPPPWP